MPQDFSGQNLRGRNFKGQDLTGANFSYADIRGTNFTNTILINTNFSGVKAGLHPDFLEKLSQFLAFLSVLGVTVSCFAAKIAISIDWVGLYSKYSAKSMRNELGLEAEDGLQVLMLISVSSLSFGLVLAACHIRDFIHDSQMRFREDEYKATNIARPSFLAVLLIQVLASIRAGWLIEYSDMSIGWITGLLSSWMTGTIITGITARLVFKSPLRSRSVIDKKRTIFRNANLTNADFTGAILVNADFQNATLVRACWFGALSLLQANVKSTYLEDFGILKLLVTKNGQGQAFNLKQDLKNLNLSGANLTDASFVGADLSGSNLDNANLFRANLSRCLLNDATLKNACLAQANLTGADISRAILNHASLENANLTKVQALGTNFYGVSITGACLEAWNIDQTTKLACTNCLYIFLLEQPNHLGSRERRPYDPHVVFQKGDFEKLYERILNTVQILLRNGINHEAFAEALQRVMEENPEINFDSIQSIEKKGDDVLLTLAVPETADKAKIAQDFLKPYEERVRQLEAKVDELQALRSTDLKDIALALANQSFNITNQAVGEGKAVQNNDSSRKLNIGSIGGDFNASGQALNFGEIDISGQVTNTINQLPASSQPDEPGIKELLEQLQRAIESAEELKSEDKAEALKQVQALAEAGKDPAEAEKKNMAKSAIRWFKGMLTELAEPSAIAQLCKKVLPHIATIFGL